MEDKTLEDAIPDDGEAVTWRTPSILHHGWQTERRTVYIKDEAQKQTPTAVTFSSVNNVNVIKRVDDEKSAEPPPYGRNKRAVLTATLIVVNMVNYMDRNTVSSVFEDVKEYFGASDANMGLVRTLFILMLTVSVIMFGYLGDRCNRLCLLTTGLLVWAAVVLSVVFLPPSCFAIFAICRMLVGIGEGSVSTIAPAMISDMFKGRARSILFACFSLMIPVGAGFGFVVYAMLGKYFGKWQTGFYFSPVLSLTSVMIIWTLIRTDPPRGKAEGASIISVERTLRSDLKHILSRKTFLLLSVGNALQLFVVGSVLFWLPVYAERSPGFLKEGWSKGDGAFYFGIVMASGGLAGVAIGGTISSILKKKGSTSVSDAYICAGSSLFSGPLMFIGQQFGDNELVALFVFVFLIVTCLSTNWSVLLDASMYVIHPRCRSLASGIQLLFTKFGGEVWSAFVVGWISERCQAGYEYRGYSNFYCLHNTLYMNSFVLIIAGFVSACASWFIDEDKKFIEELLQQEAGKTDPMKLHFLKNAADPGVDSTDLHHDGHPIYSLGHSHHRSLDLPIDLPLELSLNDSASAIDGPTDGLSVNQIPLVSAEKTCPDNGTQSSNEERVCPVVEFAAKRVQVY